MGMKVMKYSVQAMYAMNGTLWVCIFYGVTKLGARSVVWRHKKLFPGSNYRVLLYRRDCLCGACSERKSLN